MGFSEAFPELDFHRAQGSGHRKRDNKQKGWSEWGILVRGKVCCVDRSSTCKFISVFLTGGSDTVMSHAKSDRNIILLCGGMVMLV